MSGQRERERRREERILSEEAASGAERRRQVLQLAAGVVFLAIAAVVVLIVVTASNSESGGDTELEEVADVRALLDGIPQKNLVLGDPQAPVELIEFGDLQCPVCKGYSEEVLPPLIENQVRAGEVKLSFRNFTIIGPQSLPAGAAALAAGAQGRGWNYVELFYRNQGREDSGYADDEFLTSIAKAVGVGNLAKWNRERQSPQRRQEVEASTREAQKLGFSGTPSFAIKGPANEGLKALGTPGSTGALEEAIEDAS